MSAFSTIRLALRRSLAIRGLLAVVALGVIVASTLLASAPIYARAMADLSLTFKVRQELRTNAGTQVFIPDLPLRTAAGTSAREAIEARINQRLGWFTASQSRFVQLGRFSVAKPGDPPATGLYQAQPQSLEGYAAHVRVVSGRLPAPSKPGEPLQLTLSSQSASASHLGPGDVMELRESFDTCERILPTSDPPPPPPPCDPTTNVSFSFPATVVGIVDPADPTDPFWTKPAEQYFAPFRLQIADVGPILPMFTDEQALIDGFGGLFPTYHASFAWWVQADPTRLNRANFRVAQSDIDALLKEVDPLGGLGFSPLRNTLGRYGTSADYQEVPLAVLLLEITCIALFYVGIVSAIVVEQQAADVALLRGRGASAMQVCVIYLWQGLAIGIPAMILAPFLAAATTALLGYTPAFHDASGGSMIPVTIPPISFAAAAGGVVLSLLALVVPALVVARRSVTATRRAESRPTSSIIHRYYLDVILALGAGLVLFELRQRGSAFEPSSTTGLGSDPLLLASPALIIAAAAAIVLRFYPLLLRIVARSLNSVAGASLSLGLIQVVRNSAQYTRLTLLVMMAVAVGSFAASYATTTERSYRDRAGFETGADLRVSAPFGRNLEESGAATEKKLDALPGVQAASAVTRTTAGIASPGNNNANFQVLGIDPGTLPSVLWWRSDFATTSVDELIGTLSTPNIPNGRALPADATTLSVWFKGDASLSDINIWGHFRDATGRILDFEMGSANTGGGWQQRTVKLIGNLGAPLPGPISLVAFNASIPSNRPAAVYAPFLIDDITASPASGPPVVIDNFDTTLGWGTFPVRAADSDKIALGHSDVHSGTGVGVVQFASGNAPETRGIYATGQQIPLTALVSSSFLRSTGLRIGSKTLLFVGRNMLTPVTIAGVYDLFPTLNASDGPSIIVNREQLTRWADTARFGFSNDLGPSEVFVSLSPTAVPAAVEKAAVDALSDPSFGSARGVTRDAETKANLDNPLISAAGGGILFVSFVAILALVGAALLVTLVTSIQRRRVEFAVVRAMGVSAMQVFRMLVLEYSVVSVAGTVVGAFLGLLVGRQMLSFLDVTETGSKVEPGFILQTEWTVVAAAVAGIVVVMLGGLVIATRRIAAIAGAQALRTE